jgi:glycerol-3-phosphate dehydrogenase (NAD(P)+)
VNSVVVLGAGAWGTALAIQAERAGCAVVLWARDPKRAAAIAATRENPRLPGARLGEAISVVTVPPVAADLVLLAMPTQHLRGVLASLPPIAAPLLACMKGVETGTLRLPLEVVAELRPGVPAAVLTGPNFAHEVAVGLPAAAVVAAADAGLRERIAALLGTPAFRVYGNDDPVGAELGGAAKNVMAIAAGAVMGAGLGENARAALITRGLAELSRLAAALGGRAETMMGLSGLGDLLLTCTGQASRNYSFGLSLGRGQSPEAALAGCTGVIEGVTTAPALVARAAGVDLPICAEVAALLEGRKTLQQAIAALLSRPRKDE